MRKARKMTEQEAKEIAAGPTLLMSGTFALFRTPLGGLHLVYRPEGSPEDVHAELPPAMAKMLESAMNGEKTGMMGMMGMMKGMIGA